MQVSIEGSGSYTSTKNTLNVKVDTTQAMADAIAKGDEARIASIEKFRRAQGDTDTLQLTLPKSESVYKRTEFITDESMGKGCAYCYTYMEQTLTFEDEEHGEYSLTFSSTESHFIVNMDDFSKTFGKSRSDMNGISSAVEETWEYTERSFEQQTLTGNLSELISKDGETMGTNISFAAQSSAYKRTTASYTAGTVNYKDGSKAWYQEKALSNREIYNNCVAYMAESFGDDSLPTLTEKDFAELFGKPMTIKYKFPEKSSGKDFSELLGRNMPIRHMFPENSPNEIPVFTDKDFAELFGKPLNTERKLPEKHMNETVKKPLTPLEKREELLESLNRFMERNLAAARKKSPNSPGLKAFEKARLEIGSYKYSEVTTLVQRMFHSHSSTTSIYKASAKK
ncbi:MAG: hypothetical protein K2N72_11205 [Oscillospiraceae bacterium]|nr:hypothetical protein [Oscillospiraceae bacterium]